MKPAVIRGSYKYPDNLVSLQIITLELLLFLDFKRKPTVFDIFRVVSAVRGSVFTMHLIPSVPNILPISSFIENIS